MGDIRENIRKVQQKLREINEDITEFTEKAARSEREGDKANASVYRNAIAELKSSRTRYQAQLRDLQRRAGG